MRWRAPVRRLPAVMIGSPLTAPAWSGEVRVTAAAVRKIAPRITVSASLREPRGDRPLRARLSGINAGNPAAKLFHLTLKLIFTS